MDKNAKELIQKMAGVKTAVSSGWVSGMLRPKEGTPAVSFGNPGTKSSPGLAGATAKGGRTVEQRLTKAHDAAATRSSMTSGAWADSKNPMSQGAKARMLGANSSAKREYSNAHDALGEARSQKTGGMKSIINDIIKGAQDNTFGRPVQIQADTEWTPLDTAKTAGALQFLGEQGYSVKQAAEYLGLTENQVQFILKAVG